MQWLRVRPSEPSEMDLVDWRGRWIQDDEEEDEEDEDYSENEEDRAMEDFDEVIPLDNTDPAGYSQNFYSTGCCRRGR